MKKLLKNNSYILLCAFFFTSLLISCKKEKTTPQETAPYDNRDQFIGTYNVFDSLNNVYYTMSINKKDGVRDSLIINNFANKFILKTIHEKYWNSSWLKFGTYHPINDYQNNKWHLSKGYFNGEWENNLRNDTIILLFKMSNIAFYYDDGVPYYECDPCKHIAVKQN